MAIEPGNNLLHYRLVEQIGEGGMGVVWKAIDTSFDGGTAGRIIFRQAADGSSPPERLIGGQTPYYPLSFSPGDRELIFEMSTLETGVDMWILPMGGGEPRPLLVTEAFETEGVYSPDGRWIAYTSDESGVWEMRVVTSWVDELHELVPEG